MSQPLRILLASPDLMVTSRLASLGRECGAVIETVRSLDDPPPGLSDPYDVVLIDLQAHGDDPAVLVTRVRSLIAGFAGGPRLVAFGPHVHRQRLDDACAAGADEAISRGELLGSLPALVRRWSG
jgi:DNA-binding NarL/FixJ family response regulator